MQSMTIFCGTRQRVYVQDSNRGLESNGLNLAVFGVNKVPYRTCTTQVLYGTCINVVDRRIAVALN